MARFAIIGCLALTIVGCAPQPRLELERESELIPAAWKHDTTNLQSAAIGWSTFLHFLGRLVAMFP